MYIYKIRVGKDFLNKTQKVQTEDWSNQNIP